MILAKSEGAVWLKTRGFTVLWMTWQAISGRPDPTRSCSGPRTASTHSQDKGFSSVDDTSVAIRGGTARSSWIIPGGAWCKPKSPTVPGRRVVEDTSRKQIRACLTECLQGDCSKRRTKEEEQIQRQSSAPFE